MKVGADTRDISRITVSNKRLMSRDSEESCKVLTELQSRVFVLTIYPFGYASYYRPFQPSLQPQANNRPDTRTTFRYSSAWQR